MSFIVSCMTIASFSKNDWSISDIHHLLKILVEMFGGQFPSLWKECKCILIEIYFNWSWYFKEEFNYFAESPPVEVCLKSPHDLIQITVSQNWCSVPLKASNQVMHGFNSWCSLSALAKSDVLQAFPPYTLPLLWGGILKTYRILLFIKFKSFHSFIYVGMVSWSLILLNIVNSTSYYHITISIF